MFKKLFNIFIFALNIIRVVLKISLTNLNSIEGNSSKNKINLIIYIGDWLVTPLSSFVCFLAIILKQKGFTVTLLYDEFNLHKNFLSKFVNSLISLLLAVLRYKYKISYSRLADNKKK